VSACAHAGPCRHVSFVGMRGPIARGCTGPVAALTIAGLRAIRVARERGRRQGESSDLAILAFCRASDFAVALERRVRLSVGRIARGGLN